MLQLVNSTKGKKERIGKIFQMHANKENPVESMTAGHIYAVIGLKDTTTGDTLSDPNNQVVLESMTFPEPVIEVAIEPKTKADQEKLGLAIQKLAEEDPTFRTEQNQDTGQTIIKGMGELHLDILVDRMKREFNVEANVGKPQVAYRETIKRIVEKHDYTHKKQTGGSGQFAKVQISLEPLEVTAEKTYEFVNTVTGGRIPREYIPSVDARNPGRAARRRARRIPDGRRQGDPARWRIARRRLLGDGVQDCRLDGLQGGRAQGTTRSARAAHGRRGTYPRGIHGRRHRRPELASRSDPEHGGCDRRQGRSAHVPLSEMFGYVGDLRSKTSGRAVYSMTFESYAEVPKAVADEIVQKNKGE